MRGVNSCERINGRKWMERFDREDWMTGNVMEENQRKKINKGLEFTWK